jgi:glycosyltransferase involved in cell wall biosynthesis
MMQSTLESTPATGVGSSFSDRVESPLITIAVPAYNRPFLLAEALASIAAQTVRVAFEVVVYDDLGFPETRDFVSKFPQGTFHYSKNPFPLGAVGNWNQCLRTSRGKWVMVLHEDDTLYPWYFESVLPHLHNDAVAVCMKTSRGRVVPKVRRPGLAPPVAVFKPQHFLKSSMTPFPGVLVRRDVALLLGGFDESWGPIADYEFWYRLGCTGRVDQVLAVGAFYRVAPGQWTERVWGRMLGLTHLLRLRMASEQFPQYPRAGRWLARFFTYRNALCYAARFKERPAVLRRSLGLGRMSFAWLPSGWVWQALKLASRLGRTSQGGASASRRSRGYGSGTAFSAPARVF